MRKTSAPSATLRELSRQARCTEGGGGPRIKSGVTALLGGELATAEGTRLPVLHPSKCATRRGMIAVPPLLPSHHAKIGQSHVQHRAVGKRRVTANIGNIQTQLSEITANPHSATNQRRSDKVGRPPELSEPSPRLETRP